MQPSPRSQLSLVTLLVAAAGISPAILPLISGAQETTFYGTGALHSGTGTGLYSSAFGFDALYRDTTGTYNTAAGVDALYTNTTGAFNTATGVKALYANTTGSYNTADGEAALLNNTKGSYNVATGLQALHANTTGTGNTADGYQALYNCTTDSENTATGYQALFSDSIPDTTAPNQNVADGYQALYNSIYGYDNVAAGYRALYSNDNGGFNTAAGYQALYANVYGNYNTAVGGYALYTNTSGGSNTAVGPSALGHNTGGSYNTAVGINALGSNTTGANNIGIGLIAGFNLTTGSNNIDIGDTDGFGDTDDVAGENNTIRIGEARYRTQTATYIAGIYNATVTGLPVYSSSNGQLGIQAASSRRFKQNIKPMGDSSDALLSLKPVTYEYKPEIDPNGIPQFGLVAEDVEKACSNLVVRDKDGKPYAVRYDAVNVMLLNEFLKQHDRVSKLEERNAKLETAVSEQAKTLAQEQRDFQTALAQIKNLTANLKEQATLLQKVSAQVQAGNPAPRVVSNND